MIMFRSFGLPVWLLVCALPLVARGAPLTLVEQGQPNAALIVEADSPKSKKAADALQRYIQQMSGARLPRIKAGAQADADLPAVQIHVGHTSAADGQQVPSGFDPSVRDDAFENEGYVLRTLDDQTLLVAGNNDGPYKGTIYAAYALLRKLGCRFYFPGAWGEIVPEQKTITVNELDVMTRPDFPVRLIRLGGWVPRREGERETYRAWGEKVRFTGSRMYPLVGDGFLAMLVPPNEYFDKHPEFFAMSEEGRRHASTYSNGRYSVRHTMLCLSNEAMFKTAASNLEQAFAGEKDLRNVTEHGFGISPPDGTPYCYCPDCQAQSQKFSYPRYVHRTPQSEEFFDFASRLARKFPDKWAATMAYSLREFPPQGVDVPDNVAVTYAPISNDVLHPNDTDYYRPKQFMQLLTQWREQTPHVMIYDYNPGLLTGLFVPERQAENMAVNAPMYKGIDIKGINAEGRKAFMQSWISYYITARLLWDADADVDAMKRDFYTKFFGAEAGPHVRAWWDACAEALVNADMQAHEDFLINHIYDKAFTDRIHSHVEAALNAETTPAQRERVEAFALIAENLEMYAAMSHAAQRLEYMEAAEAADRMVEIKDELNAIYPFFIDRDKDNTRPYFAAGKAKTFRELAAMRNGETGEAVAPLPETMHVKLDPYNEGTIDQWYSPDHPTSDWSQLGTFYLREQQVEPMDKEGHYYRGYMWYREQVDIPERFANQPVRLRLRGLINEGWVWINGQYVGHRGHELWWSHNHTMDVDVTDAIKPGQANTIAIRVHNAPDEVGGLFRRGFFYSPNSAGTNGE